MEQEVKASNLSTNGLAIVLGEISFKGVASGIHGC